MGLVHRDETTKLGPIVVLGPEFPLAASRRRALRMGFPGPATIGYGFVHSMLVQAIIQRCLYSRRRVGRALTRDEYGFRPGIADKVVKLTSRVPVRF